jgi:hypothetical protein
VLEAVAAPLGVSAQAVLAALAAGDFLTLDEHGPIDATYPFCARPAQHSQAPGRILGQQEARALGEEIFGPLLATG